MDAALRRKFLAALDADLALDPQSLLACGPQRWGLIAARWRRREIPVVAIRRSHSRPRVTRMVPVS